MHCAIRGRLSERTSAALARAKEKGVVLGNCTNLAEAAAKGSATVRQQRTRLPLRVCPKITHTQA